MISTNAELILDTIETIDWQKVTNPAMVESKDHPFPKLFEVKIYFSRTCTIELGILDRGFAIYISFKNIGEDTRP